MFVPNNYGINQVRTLPSLREPSLSLISHSQKGRYRAVLAEKEEHNEADLNPPSSVATTFVVPKLTYENYDRAI